MGRIEVWRSAGIIGLAAAGLLAAIPLVVALAWAAPAYARSLGRRPLGAAILALLFGLLFRAIGHDLGLGDLFWHDERGVQLTAGVGVAALVLLLAFLGFLLEDPAEIPGRCMAAAGGPDRVVAWLTRGRWPARVAPADARGRLRLYLGTAILPTIAVLALAAGHEATQAGPRPWREVAALPLGAGLTFLAADLALLRAPVARWRRWHGLAAGLAAVAAVNLADALGAGWLTAATALCLVMAEAALAGFATHGRPRLRAVLLLAFLALMAFNNDDSYKLTYPGLEHYTPGPGRAPIPIRMSPRTGWKVPLPGELEFNRGRKALGERDYPRALAEFRESATKQYPQAVDQLGNALHQMDLHRAEGGAISEEMRTKLNIERLNFYLDIARRDPGNQRNQRVLAATCLMLYHQARNGPGGGPGARPPGDSRAGAGPRAWLELAIRSQETAAAADPGAVGVRVALAHALSFLAGEEPPGERRGAARVRAREVLQEAARIWVRKAAAGLLPAELGEVIRAHPQAADPPIPALADHYRRGVRWSRAGRAEEAAGEFVKVLEHAPDLGRLVPVRRYTGLLNDAEALNRWRMACAVPPGAPAPKLVVVAVSGGGIAAAGWTARCLTAIEGRSETFPARVRIITGASGGMVGAACWAAEVPQPGDLATLTPGERATRGAARRKAIRDQIDRESLTPVVRRLVLRDLPSIFCPYPQRNDRGRVLEATWEENTAGTLGRTFRSLSPGEAEGWRPSLIVSPILVEDGAQMVISNLDLAALPNVNMHFFSVFPEALPTLKLSTALRMNAAFPFVTPATNLPTNPPRRVADAGYVDNYGIRMAAEWIKLHRDWLAAHTSGVALVQVRAYPRGLRDLDPVASDGPPPASESEAAPAARGRGWRLPNLAGSLQWLSTPLEGYTTARKAAMIVQNDSMVEELARSFHAAGGGTPFFRTFIFECPEGVPLSWHLTAQGRKRLDAAIDSRPVQSALKHLCDFLGAAPDGAETRHPAG